jgi:hypothetical protein
MAGDDDLVAPGFQWWSSFSSSDSVGRWPKLMADGGSQWSPLSSKPIGRSRFNFCRVAVQPIRPWQGTCAVQAMWHVRPWGGCPGGGGYPLLRVATSDAGRAAACEFSKVDLVLVALVAFRCWSRGERVAGHRCVAVVDSGCFLLWPW